MSGRSAMILALALLSGFGAMLGARQMLARDTSQVEMIEILAAARDLQVEEVLIPEMVKVVKMPKSAAPVGSFSSFKDVAERWVRIEMLAGEPLVDAKLAAKDMPVGLLARIPAGMRAIAVDIDEQSGVSFFVQPGHHVDVVLARNRNNNNMAKAQSETILQDVLVLAAGSATIRPEEKTSEVRTITLALKPEQVDILVASQTEGTLSLSLRGHNDHEQLASRAPEPIEEIPRPVASPPPPQPIEPTPIVQPVPEPPAPAPEPVVAAYTPPRRKIVIWHGPVYDEGKSNTRKNPELPITHNQPEDDGFAPGPFSSGQPFTSMVGSSP